MITAEIYFKGDNTPVTDSANLKDLLEALIPTIKFVKDSGYVITVAVDGMGPAEDLLECGEGGGFAKDIAEAGLEILRIEFTFTEAGRKATTRDPVDYSM